MSAANFAFLFFAVLQHPYLFTTVCVLGIIELGRALFQHLFFKRLGHYLIIATPHVQCL